MKKVLMLLMFMCWNALSLAGLSLTSSPNTNGSYCPGKVTFTCVGTDEPIGVSWRINGIIIDAYTYTFGNQGNEKFPEVIFMDDNITITVKNAEITSASTHNITIELSGNVSNLLQSSVLCRTAVQISNTFIVTLEVPEISNNIRVDPIYNFHTRTLSEIHVFWNASNGLCMEYSYQVMLTDGSITLKSENVQCRRASKCQVTFRIMSQMFHKYIIQVITLDFRGLAVSTSILPPIYYVLSILPNISVEFFPCFIRCYSDFNVSGTCEIYFPEGSVSGTVNSEDIQVLETLQSGTVHFNATFNIDGRTYTIQNSSDIQCKQGELQVVPIIVGSIVGTIVAVLCVSLVVPFFLFLKKNMLKGTQNEPSEAVYDEINEQKQQVGSKYKQDDGIKMSSNECYGRTTNENISMNDCEAYSTLT